MALFAHPASLAVTQVRPLFVLLSAELHLHNSQDTPYCPPLLLSALCSAHAVATCMQLADVLHLVVQHSPDLQDFDDVFNLLCVSQACRQQLQRAGRARCSVDFWGRISRNPATRELAEPWPGKLRSPVDFCEQTFRKQAARAAAFASWLPKHSMMVSQLDLRCNAAWSLEQHVELQEACASALQDCRNAGAAVQLETVKVWLTPGKALPRLLQGLVGSGLQELHMVQAPQPGLVSAELFAALGQLTSLRHLHINMGLGDAPKVANHVRDCAVMAAVQHLTHLTCLDYSGPLDPANALQLPSSLRSLEVFMWDGNPDASYGGVQELDLQHLTALHGLVWRGSGSLDITVR